MAKPVIRRLRKLLPWALGLFAGGIVLVLVIAYSGIFNIAASAGHPAWLEWLLTLGKARSVIVNSKSVEVPVLNLTELVPLGAAHFQGGCATCHRTPGQVLNPVYDKMLPPPPNLQINAPLWTRKQLFWMVRHGIQFTGMPSWSGQDRDDEVWAVVAFLEALPLMEPADYLKYASGNNKNNTGTQSYPASEFVDKGRPKINLSSCNRCHDTGDAPPTSPYVPRLGGQDKAYLKRALHEYHSDLRQSGFMEPISAELDDDHINSLADYYASLTVSLNKSARYPSSPELELNGVDLSSTKPSPAGEGWVRGNQNKEKSFFNSPHPNLLPQGEGAHTLKSTALELELGRQLAVYGDRLRKVPPCLSCHGESKRSDYPRLGGQSEQYLRQQLQVLKRGIRAKTPYGKIMTTIAQRLTEKQAEAAAAFFASQSTERTENKAAEGPRQ